MVAARCGAGGAFRPVAADDRAPSAGRERRKQRTTGTGRAIALTAISFLLAAIAHRGSGPGADDRSDQHRRIWTSCSTEVGRAAIPGHTTYRLGAEPEVTMPWTYADARPGGTFARVGGGEFDPATGY